MNKVCEMVASRIIDQLQNGVIPWEKPWSGIEGGAVSHSTGRPYSLLNQFLLGRPGEWITFLQVKSEGGKIKKGEKGSPVVFWKQLIHKDELTGEEKVVPVLRYYTVFNTDQVEGIESKFFTGEIHHVDPIAEGEKVISEYIGRSGISLSRDNISDKAYYNPGSDSINLPCIDQYKRPEEFYSTAFHEMTHSTGHPTRLNRFKQNEPLARFGSQSYIKEELVAEIGAATLCNICGIESDHSFRNSTAYIQSWLSHLKNDPNMIISASGKAEKAVNLILNRQV